jgi:ABC-type amino acid transport substrate-binding protein
MKKLTQYLLLTFILLMVSIVGLRFLLGMKEAEYIQDKEMVQMFISRDTAPSKVFLDTIPPAVYDPYKTRLENIRQRGYIRVGFIRDRLPSAFINNSGDLVGSDIEMAHILANDLGVSIEFIRIDNVEMVSWYLTNKAIDILMTGTVLNLDWVEEIAYTTPYQDQTLAFLVRDYRRNEFSNIEDIRKLDSLRIGIGQGQYYTEKIINLFPNAEVVQLASPRLFVRDSLDRLDALAFTAESGGAWSIIYPEFSVAIPQPVAFKIPQAYVVSRDDQEFLNFINTWIYLKKTDGSFDSALRYWVMGRGIQETKEPRWSVIRNVLHWVD